MLLETIIALPCAFGYRLGIGWPQFPIAWVELFSSIVRRTLYCEYGKDIETPNAVSCKSTRSFRRIRTNKSASIRHFWPFIRHEEPLSMSGALNEAKNSPYSRLDLTGSWFNSLDMQRPELMGLHQRNLRNPFRQPHSIWIHPICQLRSWRYHFTTPWIHRARRNPKICTSSIKSKWQ